MTSNDNPAAADAADTTSGELVVGDDGTGTGGSQPPAGVAPADVVGREPWRGDWWRSASDVSDIVAIGSRSDWQWHRSWWLNSTAIRAAFAAGGEYRCMADASGVLFRAAFNASVAAAGGVALSPDTIANHQLACVVAATRWLVNSGAVSRAADVGEVVAAREWLNNPTLVAADVAVAAFVEKMMVVSGAPADNVAVLTEAVIAAISAISDFLAAQPPATTSSQPPAGVAADVVVPTDASAATTSASALAAIGLPPVPPVAVWWQVDGGLRATYHDGGLLVLLGELRELATTSVDAITLTLHSTSGATTSYLLAGGAADVGELVADAAEATGGEPLVAADDFVRLPNEVVGELVAGVAPADVVGCLLQLNWRHVKSIDATERWADRARGYLQRSYHCDGARLVVEFKNGSHADRHDWRGITRVMYRDADDATRDWDWPDKVAGGKLPPFVARAADGGFLWQFNHSGWV